ncbi:YbjQ family protein [Acidobacteriota bacterium]
MIITTTDSIPGKKVTRILGVAKGNTIRSRHVGKDILAIFRNLVGGEVHEYTKMMAETREQALDRMIEDGKEMGADAILMIRFSTSEVMSGAAELLAYGTAVKLEDE